jgi:hypothetical protein
MERLTLSIVTVVLDSIIENGISDVSTGNGVSTGVSTGEILTVA